MKIAFVHFNSSDAHIKCFIEEDEMILDKEARFFTIWKDEKGHSEITLMLDNVNYIEIKDYVKKRNL
jgi:hypothetical protein